MYGSAEGFGIRPRTEGIIVHHTGFEPIGDALLSWIAISKDHFNKGWQGIGYHYGIDPDGTIRQLGNINSWRAHIAQLNDRYIGVALLGDFTIQIPTSQQLDALEWLVSYLRGIYGDLPCYGHREVAIEATACPGATWKEWLPL